MYEWTGDEYWLEKAKTFTYYIEQEELNGTTYDMGFKIYCSFGTGYRITKDEHYRALPAGQGSGKAELIRLY